VSTLVNTNSSLPFALRYRRGDASERSVLRYLGTAFRYLRANGRVPQGRISKTMGELFPPLTMMLTFLGASLVLTLALGNLGNGIAAALGLAAVFAVSAVLRWGRRLAASSFIGLGLLTAAALRPGA
jgi:hypothetical protein